MGDFNTQVHLPFLMIETRKWTSCRYMNVEIHLIHLPCTIAPVLHPHSQPNISNLKLPPYPLQVGRAPALRGREPPLGNRQQVPELQQSSVGPLRLLPPAAAVQEGPGERGQPAAAQRPLPLVCTQQLSGHWQPRLPAQDQLLMEQNGWCPRATDDDEMGDNGERIGGGRRKSCATEKRKRDGCGRLWGRGKGLKRQKTQGRWWEDGEWREEEDGVKGVEMMWRMLWPQTVP